MVDVVLNPGVGGATLHTDTVGGVDTQIVKVGYGDAGISPILSSTTNPFPVSVRNFPAIQNVAVTNFPANQNVNVTNVVAVQGSFTVAAGSTPLSVTIDNQLIDEDGYPYVSTNIPGSDPATGDGQSKGTAVLTQILSAVTTPLSSTFPSQVKVWDGTTSGSIKPAAAIPISSDPALVVTLSPNSQLQGIGPMVELLSQMLGVLQIVSLQLADISGRDISTSAVPPDQTLNTLQ